MITKIWLSILLIAANLANAQMPESDVCLFKLKRSKIGEVSIVDTINISHRKGYDNQPSFSYDEKKIYYVSVREDKQADIYVYDLKSKKTQRLTQSAESEYSPQINAEGDKISVVAVERDSAQRIHVLLASNGIEIKKLPFDSVGYYQFLNADTLIYYKLTNPHSLHLHVISSGENKWLCDNPTRGFKTINRSKLFYAVKDSNSVQFFIYDFTIQKAKPLCKYPSLNEDAFWHSEYGLMKSEDSQILRYIPNKNTWQMFLDLKNYGIKKITRFVFDSKDKYLIVVNNL